MKTKPSSAERQAQLDHLATLSDTSIDTINIPETPAENWRLAQRPGLYRPVKQPAALRLDADVVASFKEHARDRGYQTEINFVLRRHITQANARS